MSNATFPITESKWRHDLSGRDKDFTLFKIPRDYAKRWNFHDGTKRYVRVTLSDGRSLKGYCTITSGIELRMPKRYKDDLRNLQWFDCEGLGYESSDKASLEWE